MGQSKTHLLKTSREHADKMTCGFCNKEIDLTVTPQYYDEVQDEVGSNVVTHFYHLDCGPKTHKPIR